MTEQEQMIDDCINRQSCLSEWEFDFVASISEVKDNGQTLTLKQATTLDSIWEKATEQG